MYTNDEYKACDYDDIEGKEHIEESSPLSSVLDSLRVFVVTATLFLGGTTAIGESLYQFTQKDNAPENQTKIEIVISGKQQSIPIGPRPICYAFGSALTALILCADRYLSRGNV